MFHLQYLFQLFEWHACEIAVCRKAVPRIAKRANHYNHQFTIYNYPIGYPSDHPLTKKHEDSGYDTAAWQARKRGWKAEKPCVSRLQIITHFSSLLN